MLIFLFLQLHRQQRLQNIRELTIDANQLEQVLKYRKASFPKSVSTTFVAHCRPFALCKNFSDLRIKFVKGGNCLPQHFEHNPNIRLIL